MWPQCVSCVTFTKHSHGSRFETLMPCTFESNNYWDAVRLRQFQQRIRCKHCELENQFGKLNWNRLAGPKDGKTLRLAGSQANMILSIVHHDGHHVCFWNAVCTSACSWFLWDRLRNDLSDHCMLYNYISTKLINAILAPIKKILQFSLNLECPLLPLMLHTCGCSALYSHLHCKWDLLQCINEIN